MSALAVGGMGSIRTTAARSEAVSAQNVRKGQRLNGPCLGLPAGFEIGFIVVLVASAFIRYFPELIDLALAQVLAG
jgi:hypothetical protein